MLLNGMHVSSRLGLIAAIFFAILYLGGIGAQCQLDDSSYYGSGLLEPGLLPAGIVLPPGVEAMAFNSSFAMGSIFFGQDGIAYVFFKGAGTLKLMAIDSYGRARTYAESELLKAPNFKTGIMLEPDILMIIDYWPDGGNPYSGIFVLKPDGSFRKWNLTTNYDGMNCITPAPDGGWFFSDFEKDNIWHISKEGAAETPVITKGDIPPGLCDLAYDSARDVLYALNLAGGWPAGGLFAVYRITDDGQAVLFAKVNETSAQNGGMAMSTGGPFGHSLYVTDAAGGKLIRVDSDGGMTPVITGLVDPGQMKFNPVSGDLMIICDGKKELVWLGSDGSVDFSADAEAQKQKIAVPLERNNVSSTDPLDGAGESEIFNNWNADSVQNGPTCNPSFEISSPHYISYIDTYHWNDGQGSTTCGTISLKKDDGEILGPWTVVGEIASGVANAWWKAYPGVEIPAGTYMVMDSQPETWSRNSGSGGCGFSKVMGQTVRNASPLPQEGEREILAVREYSTDEDRHGKLLWDVEGYRYEGDKEFKVLKRGSIRYDNPDSFAESFALSGGLVEGTADSDKVPVCIIDEGKQFVPHGKIRSWVTYGGEFDSPVIEGEYRDGLKSGHWTFLSTPEVEGVPLPARKAEEGDYVDGLKEGHWIYYDQLYCKNMISREGNYSKGIKLESTWKEYEYVTDSNGNCIPGKASFDHEFIDKMTQ